MAQNRPPPTSLSNVYYYVPQDKDDPEVPNAYCIPLQLEEIRMADIQKYFPLAGEYIFRFKYKYENQIVWIDIHPKSKKLPLFQGRIILKATRISWESKKQESLSTSSKQQSELPPNAQLLKPQKSRSQEVENKLKPTTEYNFFDDATEPTNSQQMNSQNNINSTNLLDF